MRPEDDLPKLIALALFCFAVALLVIRLVTGVPL